ncbi:activator-dependent family glycosyltransferase [Nonomuraea terrae]|uniref:activator-dependent family glycosyltransferase n=1 Tax=Nonomuraea terrae TaxID=2530383 RepID=UPI0037B15F96
MRVLITCYPVTSHFYVLVPLAWALRTAGHEVVVAARPDIHDDIVKAGLTAVTVGDEMDMTRLVSSLDELPDDGTPYGMGYDIAETRPELLTLDYVKGALGLHCCIIPDYLANEAMLTDLVAFAEHWKPDLVIWDFLTFPGPITAKAVGAAHARVLVGVDHAMRMRARFHELRAQDPDGPQDDPVADWLAARGAPFGVDFDEELLTGQVTLDPYPPFLSIPLDLPTVPVRFTSYNGSSTYPDWLLEPPTRKRVCLSLGASSRVAGVHDTDKIQQLLRAMGELDAEVIATLNADQLQGVTVPDNVRVFDFVPLNALLPSCDAIVNHVGYGTMGTALIHGVPQVMAPENLWGESMLARRIEERGAGICIPPEEVTPESIAGALRRVLEDPSFKTAAEQLQKDQQTVPTPAEAVHELERLVERRRR